MILPGWPSAISREGRRRKRRGRIMGGRMIGSGLIRGQHFDAAFSAAESPAKKKGQGNEKKRRRVQTE